jgi:acyl-CoA synthetase (AMP-forming)/AMP-acid ligase II
MLDESTRKDIYLLNRFCKKTQTTHVFLTAKLAEEFLHLKDLPKSLVTLIVAGEKFNTAIDLKFHIINEYGTTENTVCATKYKSLRHGSNLPIGAPINNTKVYILDTNLAPVPIKAVGELYVSGAGLARGYLNKADLTAEKFIANPFCANSRLYKTGDLVRWLEDGNIEYIGRNDGQIKIMGYRIELGEIENILLRYKGIKQCIVIANGSENKYLIAYYVCTEALNEEVLRKYLAARLPQHMIPSFFVHLRNLPLTVNGKIDKNALPKPNFINIGRYDVPPQNELEKQLCKIWSELLQVDYEKLGTLDDFFQLGGNSILAIKLVRQINSILNIECSVSTILEHKNILNISKAISHLNNTSYKGTKYVFKRNS